MSPSIGIARLVTKARIAAMEVCKLLARFRDISYKTFFKIFDTKVQPILTYSAELWGHTRLESVERIHLLACKRFLGVPRSTPNRIVYGDLHRYPLYINCSIKALKYWFTVLSMTQDRLPRQAYDMLVSLDERGKQCWVSAIRDMLCRAGFGVVWLQQGVGNVKSFIAVFKQRQIDMYIQEWNETVENRERYANYRSFKTIFCQEMFVNVLTHHQFRGVYAMLRAGMLPINANLARYKNEPNRQNCPLCNAVEDEKHFLFVCPLYAILRSKYKITPTEQNLDGNLIALMANYNKNIISSTSFFVYNALKLRSRFTEALRPD